MPKAEDIKPWASLLTVLLPLAEKYLFEVLPVNPRVREDALPATTLLSLLCILAGYATARHTPHGLSLGWISLILAIIVLIWFFTFIDLVPRGERALYLLFFSFVSLSAASFLAKRCPR